MQVTPRFKQTQPKRQRRSGTAELKSACAAIAQGKCQADGLHDNSCPALTLEHSGYFVAHRVIPARQGGLYELSNMLWVWNGETQLGSGGCHGMIHQNGRRARVLGLLSEGIDDPWFNIGIEQAVFERFIEAGNSD